MLIFTILHANLLTIKLIILPYLLYIIYQNISKYIYLHLEKKKLLIFIRSIQQNPTEKQDELSSVRIQAKNNHKNCIRRICFFHDDPPCGPCGAGHADESIVLP